MQQLDWTRLHQRGQASSEEWMDRERMCVVLVCSSICEECEKRKMKEEGGQHLKEQKKSLDMSDDVIINTLFLEKSHNFYTTLSYQHHQSFNVNAMTKVETIFSFFPFFLSSDIKYYLLIVQVSTNMDCMRKCEGNRNEMIPHVKYVGQVLHFPMFL